MNVRQFMAIGAASQKASTTKVADENNVNHDNTGHSIDGLTIEGNLYSNRCVALCIVPTMVGVGLPAANAPDCLLCGCRRDALPGSLGLGFSL